MGPPLGEEQYCSGANRSVIDAWIGFSRGPRRGGLPTSREQEVQDLGFNLVRSLTARRGQGVVWTPQRFIDPYDSAIHTKRPGHLIRGAPLGDRIMMGRSDYGWC